MKERTRIIQDNELKKIVIDTELGMIVINENNITYAKGDTCVTMNRNACNISKYRNASHDDTDMYDIPTKQVSVCLIDGKDTIVFSRQNRPWTIIKTHTGERMKLP